MAGGRAEDLLHVGCGSPGRHLTRGWHKAALVTGLTVTFDGAAVTATDDSTARNWSDWHAVIAPASTGPHVLMATASGSGKTNAQTVRLQAYPVLSCVSPAPSAGITASTSLVILGIQVGTAAFAVSPGGWQFQSPVRPWG